ncbi:AAC(3) family N-acetyltransferase [Marinifilum caeruleilacunae]|uniref:Aminoglycoside N(3)-acetyltransferase n=1 Tax=Marinifilum caeruleilacunae TaxID=2499076 RepID=A0ABX1WT25_9BACT|nr:AAC(3) family N-acetyltransferase [Marinifilum caeruleilacunae]NOU59222.1 aminoglycoside N(3)-acetyltransferase [Marinifilum caeruleilacunae]
MKTSLYTKVGKVVKKIFGIEDFSLFRKNVHKRLGMIFYHKKYTADDIITVMKEMGMKRGSLVCIHASMKEFYNYSGTTEELIDKILETIGGSGTLVMPAFPDVRLFSDTYIFDPINDKTGAGYLAEVFRKYKGVQRSINVQSSVCAIGPLTDYLCNDHHKSRDCWDTSSPWYRLCEKDGLIFNLGMPRNYISTFEHCVESILQYEHPYWAQFFTKEKVYKYYDEDKNVQMYKSITSEIERRPHEPTIFKWLTKNDWAHSKISNLEIKVFYSKSCLNKMLNLGRLGVSLYWVPSSKKYIF